jgi:hypothetical protein
MRQARATRSALNGVWNGAVALATCTPVTITVTLVIEAVMVGRPVV